MSKAYRRCDWSGGFRRGFVEAAPGFRVMKGMVGLALPAFGMLVLSALVGCKPPPRTYAIESGAFRSVLGDVEFTTFMEVPDSAVCEAASRAADKGMREGSPGGTTIPAGRQSKCTSELPPELKKVEKGERLAGAFVIKASSPDGPPGHTVVRGFPMDRPDIVCRLLTHQMRERDRSGQTTFTCQYPLEIKDERGDGHN